MSAPDSYTQFEPNQRAYLVSLSQHGRVRRACRDADISFNSPWYWRQSTEGFLAAENEAKDIGAETLVEAAYTRAVDGIEIPVFYEGDRVGSYLQYSDKLLDTLLKGHRPDTYKERRELSGDPNRPLTIGFAERLSAAKAKSKPSEPIPDGIKRSGEF